MSYIVVGYYTRDTLYEDKAKVLIKSLLKFNIPYYIEAIDNLGCWWFNTQFKSTFIKQTMKKFPDDNIAYVDCDAEFLRYPLLFDDLKCSIAAHLFDRSLYMKTKKKPELLSGTIFFRNCKSVLKVVENWEKECLNNPYVWDQKSLAKILQGCFYKLPAEYCTIYDTMKTVEDPVIIHYQASREVRNNKGILNIRRRV